MIFDFLKKGKVEKQEGSADEDAKRKEQQEKMQKDMQKQQKQFGEQMQKDAHARFQADQQKKAMEASRKAHQDFVNRNRKV